MKNEQLRCKAWVCSKGLQKGFEEVGDQQGAQLFDLIKIILQMDELTLSRFLYHTLQFAKNELANCPSNN